MGEGQTGSPTANELVFLKMEIIPLHTLQITAVINQTSIQHKVVTLLE